MKKERIYNEYGEIEWREKKEGERLVKCGPAFVSVSDQFREDYQREINRIFAKAHRDGTCVETDFTGCQGDCEFCRSNRPRNLSLPMSDPEDADWEPAAANACDPSTGNSLIRQAEGSDRETVLKCLAVRQLLEKLAATEPEAVRICELTMDGKADTECARILGWSETSFRRRRDRLFHRLSLRKDVQDMR